MDEPQRCISCDYDLTGLGDTGHLVACPECGTDNRIGETPPEYYVAPLPAWWALILRLGWPACVTGTLALVAHKANDPAFTRGVLNLTLLVFAAGFVRAVLLGMDCSRPGRRLKVVGAAVAWGFVGGLLLFVAAYFLTWFVAWFGHEIAKAL